MKKPYTIVPDASTPSSRELADWLAKDHLPGCPVLSRAQRPAHR